MADHHVLATGSRGYQHRSAMWTTLDRVHAARPITLLGIGGCYSETPGGIPFLRGADLFAFEWAIKHSVPCLVLSADWDQFGKSAGPRRDAKLVPLVKPQTVVAAPGGTGTRNMVERCRAAGAEVVEVDR